jgi:hypothetical protein
LLYKPESGDYAEEGIVVPISINFFWPDAWL